MEKVFLLKNQRYDAYTVLEQVKNTPITPKDAEVEEKMRKVLPELKKHFGGLASEVETVYWRPSLYGEVEADGRIVHGTVIDGAILVFENRTKRAVKTFFHEYVESVIKSPFMIPYAEMANMLIQSFRQLWMEKFKGTGVEAFDTAIAPFEHVFHETNYRDQEVLIESLAAFFMAVFWEPEAKNVLQRLKEMVAKFERVH